MRPYPLVLENPPWHDPEKPGSTAHYRDKVLLVVRNSFDQRAEVWNPLWESTDVPPQTPLWTRLQKEDRDAKDGWDKEECCITLDPGGKAKVSIGLMQPSVGDGLGVRLHRGDTGFLIFLMKVAGEMRYAKVKI